MNREIYNNMGGWSRLMFLLVFTFFGFCLAVLAVGLLANIQGRSMFRENLIESVSFLKAAQIIQAACLFLLPSLIYAFLFHKDIPSFLKLKVNPNFKAIILTVILVIIAQPTIHLLSYYNQQMSLPEFLSGIEAWMKESEKATERIIQLFIADNSVLGILTNILIIAVLAGIVEEIFFRGTLQQIFNRITKNKHFAIWTVGIIFSAIHFQFYGFFPRVLAGALLGYLFAWSGNLWLPIVAHIVHNGINLIIPHLYYGTPKFKELEYMGMERHVWLGAISVILLCLIPVFLRKKGDLFLHK